MLQIHVSKRLWSYGVLTAVYLINRLPIRVLDFKSPLEVLQITSPKLARIWMFMFCAFTLIKTGQAWFQSCQMYFLRVFSNTKGYRCYDPSWKKKYMYQEMLYLPKILLITLPHVKKRMILTCFRCLVPVIMIRIYVLCHNKFLKLESSPFLINLLPPLLRIFRVHVQHFMFFSQL